MRSQGRDWAGKYDGFTDEELIDKLRDGENDIYDYLCDKYKDMVRAKARTMFILGADQDDLIQEGMIGLFKAVRDYDAGRDASFSTFAGLCVTRQMYTAINASGRKKHLPLNSFVSLYAEDDDRRESAEVIDRSVQSSQDSDPESLVIAKESAAAIEKWIETELSSFEKQVIELHIAGMGYAEIAGILGKEAKSTDNALQRAKAKLRKHLSI